MTLEMTPEEYGHFLQGQNMAEIISKVIFNKERGNFHVDVYMSPEEYSRYAQDKVLPKRLDSLNLFNM